MRKNTRTDVVVVSGCFSETESVTVDATEKIVVKRKFKSELLEGLEKLAAD